MPSADARDVLGVNNRVELAGCAADFAASACCATLMLSGVTITDPANTYVDVDVRDRAGYGHGAEHLFAARHEDRRGLRYRPDDAH